MERRRKEKEERDEKYRVEMREEGDEEIKNGSGGTSSALGSQSLKKGWNSHIGIHTLHSTVSPMCYSAIPRSKLHRPPFCMNPDSVLGEVMPSSLWSYLHDEWHVHSQLLLLQKLSY